jgi:hypothetical protein
LYEEVHSEKIVILFIEKTWSLWWILAIILAVRWFHLLSAGAKMEGLDALASEEGRGSLHPFLAGSSQNASHFFISGGTCGCSANGPLPGNTASRMS